VIYKAFLSDFYGPEPRYHGDVIDSFHIGYKRTCSVDAYFRPSVRLLARMTTCFSCSYRVYTRGNRRNDYSRATYRAFRSNSSL